MEPSDFPFRNEYDWKGRVQIGEGGFGVVYKVRSLRNGEYVAVKQLDMKKFDEEYKKAALRTEIIAMKELTSEHTVQLLDFSYGYIYTFIVLQLCSTDLKQELRNSGEHFSEDKAVKVFREILAGFKVLAEHGYIHRDVKPENILLKDTTYKLADYGFCKKVACHQEKLKQICGTPFYMAPQLLYQKEYTSQCDIWSLGLVLYEMIFGYSPWCNRNLQVMKKSVVCKPVAFPYNCGIGCNVKDFLQRSLQLEQRDRLTWKQVFSHPLYLTGQKGDAIKHTQVDSLLLRILIRVQESSSRKFINVSELFKKYERQKKSIDKETFHALMTEIDPQITSYENHCIFMAVDSSKDGFVDLQEFKQFYVEVDYRPTDDIAARRIEEIVKMAEARKLNVRDVFNLFDKDKSTEIDYEEFESFIKHIAPQLPTNEVRMMWTRFDKDKSGKISQKEFIQEFTRSVPGQGSRNIENMERAKRNVSCLRDFLKSRNVTAEQVFGKAKVSVGNSMRIEEFEPIIRSINYVITKQEIVDMFHYIDANSSGSIELGEIARLLDARE